MLTTMRILFIIGIILTAGFLVWLFIAANSNGQIDIDEFSIPAFFYGLLMLGLTIYGTVKGVRTKK